MKTDLTFIIPVYNTDLNYVSCCFESISQQITDYRFATLVVDDGSEVRYSAALRELAISKGFDYVRIDNGGVSSARNAGIDRARGNYVAFVDADDVISPFFAQDFLDAAYGLNVDYVVGLIEGANSSEIDSKSMGFRASRDEDIKLLSKDSLIASFLLEGLDGVGPGRLRSCPVARIQRRDFASHAPFNTSFSLGEDTLQNLSILSRCEKVGVIWNTCYLYRSNPDSVCHSFDPDRVNKVEKLLYEIRKVVTRDYPDAAANMDSLVLCWLITLVKTYFLNPDYKGESVAEFKALVSKPLWRSAVSRSAVAKLPVRYGVAAALVRLGMTRVLFRLCR